MSALGFKLKLLSPSTLLWVRNSPTAQGPQGVVRLGTAPGLGEKKGLYLNTTSPTSPSPPLLPQPLGRHHHRPHPLVLAAVGNPGLAGPWGPLRAELGFPSWCSCMSGLPCHTPAPPAPVTSLDSDVLRAGFRPAQRGLGPLFSLADTLLRVPGSSASRPGPFFPGAEECVPVQPPACSPSHRA